MPTLLMEGSDGRVFIICPCSSAPCLPDAENPSRSTSAPFLRPMPAKLLLIVVSMVAALRRLRSLASLVAKGCRAMAVAPSVLPALLPASATAPPPFAPEGEGNWSPSKLSQSISFPSSAASRRFRPRLRNGRETSQTRRTMPATPPAIPPMTAPGNHAQERSGTSWAPRRRLRLTDIWRGLLAASCGAAHIDAALSSSWDDSGAGERVHLALAIGNGERGEDCCVSRREARQIRAVRCSKKGRSGGEDERACDVEDVRGSIWRRGRHRLGTGRRRCRAGRRGGAGRAGSGGGGGRCSACRCAIGSAGARRDHWLQRHNDALLRVWVAAACGGSSRSSRGERWPQGERGRWRCKFGERQRSRKGVRGRWRCKGRR